MASVPQMDAIVEAKRAVHPELAGPLTWEGFTRICEREGVAIVHAPLPNDAVLLAGLGTAVIVLNRELPIRRHTYRGTHELAHLWVHADQTPAFYTMRDYLAPDAREDDAEYIATRLLQGW